MTATLLPFPLHQFFDNSGAPLASGKVYTYEAGTTTPLATYTDFALSVAHANPIILNSAGRPPAGIYLLSDTYKVVVKDSADTTLWTLDNILAVAGHTTNLDITGTAGENLSANDCVYLSDGSGSLTAGRFYKTDSDTTYASLTAKQIGFATEVITSGSSGPIRIVGRLTGFAGLSAGSSYYCSATAGSITSTAPTSGNVRLVGTADSTTSIIIPAAPVEGGVDVLGTAGEAIAARECVYLSDGTGSRTAGRWYLADSDTVAYSVGVAKTGIAMGAIASGSVGLIRVDGAMGGFSGLTAGANQYISSTAGALTETAPTANARTVAVATSTTAVVLVPQDRRREGVIVMPIGSYVGPPITTGYKGQIWVGNAAITITGWSIMANAAGAIVVDVNMAAHPTYPTASIAGSELPTLSAAQAAQDLALSTWTTAVPADSWLGWEVNSVDGSMVQCTVCLSFRRDA